MATEGNGLTFGEVTVDDQPIAEAPEITAVDQIVEVQPDDEIVARADESLTPEEQKALLDEYFPLPDDFPSDEQLKSWEIEYGRLRIHRMAPKEAYIVRALTRSEFRQYLAILRKKFGNTVPDPAEERMIQEELLVEKCVLYPEVTASDIRGDSKPVHKIGLAGTVSILAFDIQEISNLIDSSVGPFEEI